MTPPKGVTDDQLGRYYRKTMAIADRLGKSLDPNTVLWLLQRIHDGEQFVPDRAGTTLSLVDTFDAPAIDRFVPKTAFKKTLKPPPSQEFWLGSGKVSIHCSHSYELFKHIFLHGKNGKLETNIGPRTLRICRANDTGDYWTSYVPTILAELGRKHTVRLGHIWHMLELEAAGKPTPLLTDGKKNCFFVYGRDGRLYGFHLCKVVPSGDSKFEPFWSLSVFSTSELNHPCYPGDQVISA